MSLPMVEYADRHSRQMMDLSTYLFKKRRIIFLTEDISDDTASNVIRQLLYLSMQSEEDITMLINSRGGSVSAGLAIYDAMHGLSCQVSTVCVGTAASMGAFILAAGAKGKRYGTPHSEIMIHQVMGTAQGQATDIEIAAARISRIKAEVNGLLSSFTGQPLGRIVADTERDLFMRSDEAVKYGIIDGVKDCLF